MPIIKNDEELKYKYRGKKVNGKRIDMQRYVMEQILGRKLTKDEIVHHIDGNKLNNDPSNLQIMSRAEHARLHMKEGSLYVLTRSPEEKSRIAKEAWEKGFCDKLKKPVCAFDPETNELVKEYESINAAERDGWTGWLISACCQGKIKTKDKTYRKLIWRFKNEVNKEEGVAL